MYPGRMNKDPRDLERDRENIYIWIDILGFSAALEQESEMDALMKNLTKFRAKFEGIKDAYPVIISDGLLVVMTDPSKIREFIEKVKEIQKELITQDIPLFLRGGIAIGRHFEDGINGNADHSKNWFMGSGLARAVKIESKDICWPIIGTNQKYFDEIKDYFTAKYLDINELENLFMKGYNEKGDTIYFIDYLDNNQLVYDGVCKQYLIHEDKGDKRVSAKYRWLLRYYHYKYSIPESSRLNRGGQNGIY